MTVEVLYSQHNFPIENAYITGVHLSATIDNLFLEGRIVIQDPTSVYAQHIRLGELVTIRVREDNKNATVRSYSMRIRNYAKTAAEDNPLVIQSLEVFLLSDWFYQQERKTAAYRGSVSAIISEIVSKERFFQVEGRRTFIEKSTDEEAVRYRMGTTQTSFIEQITKYGVTNNSPLYSYMDHKSNFYVMSWQSMIDNKLPYILAPLKGEEAGGSVYASEGSFLLPMYGYSFYTQADALSSQRDYSFDTAHVPYNPPKKVIIDSIESDSPLVSKASPIGDGITYHWWINPQDGLSLALHDHIKKDAALFQMIAVIDTAVMLDIRVGSSIVVAHQQEDNKEVGTYVITAVEEVWTNENSLTKLYLSKV